MVPKPKAQLLKLFQNVYGITSQKFEFSLIKSMQNGRKIKSFQSIVITLVKDHICLFLQVRKVTWLRTSCVWLNWIDHWNFILDYRLVHTWSTPITHKSNVQWILIPFVWLYVFKCDVYTPLLVDQTQKDFWIFYIFLKVFLYFCVFRVFIKIVHFLFLSKKLF